jgi:hypothetical protein
MKTRRVSGLPSRKVPNSSGKTSRGADRIPGLAGHLRLGIGRRRDAAEVAVGHVLDLVVIVEHHAAEAGHAEVLEQHVAREDVGVGQFLDGVAVLQTAASRLSSSALSR